MRGVVVGRWVGGCLTGVLVAVSVSGCGSGDSARSCREMRQVMSGFSRPQPRGADAMVGLYTGAATKVRRFAEKAGDGQVRSAGERLAVALDGVAGELRRSGGRSLVPDTAALTSANAEVQRACSRSS